MKRFFVLLICSGMFFSAGCGNDKKAELASTKPKLQHEKPEETEPVHEEPSLEGMAINPLTGLYIDEDVAKKILSENEIIIKVNLFLGDYSAYVWGCDLSYEYVKINGDYRS